MADALVKVIIEFKYPLTTTVDELKADLQSRGMTVRRVFTNDILGKVSISVESDRDRIDTLRTVPNITGIREMGTAIATSGVKWISSDQH